jgi:hypothetical protein
MLTGSNLATSIISISQKSRSRDPKKDPSIWRHIDGEEWEKR